jgi:hypothetical protein
MKMLSSTIFGLFIHFGQVVFGPDHFDWVFLVGFFIAFNFNLFILNHCDNNIIWVATKNK